MSHISGFKGENSEPLETIVWFIILSFIPSNPLGVSSDYVLSIKAYNTVELSPKVSVLMALSLSDRSATEAERKLLICKPTNHRIELFLNPYIVS